ncbi:ABC transporter ATP-binding protein [Chitinasiproducens palmae]|nr:dipeptide ABC transporter ATP-binding protein [Chitinasiproducens palmae]
MSDTTGTMGTTGTTVAGSAPARGSAREPRSGVASAPLLSLRGLSVRFEGAPAPALAGLDLDVEEGERHALVGESGSGKSVTALAVLRLLDGAQLDGTVAFAGQSLLTLPERAMRGLRGADIAMIFQEPMSALNPLQAVGRQIAESVRLHDAATPAQAAQRALDLLARTGIVDPARRYHSLPHQLSGGERQRVMIAMALACRPRLLIADEPTTALDMTIRNQIVDLLRALQEEGTDGRRLAVLLITHDLHLVRRFADRVSVIERGRIVETGSVPTVFGSPQHPYTRRLLDARPRRGTLPPPQAEAPLLEATGIGVRYRVTAARTAAGWRALLPGSGMRDFDALADVDLLVRPGETVGVVGESGSGKSTLGMALLGLVPLHAGTVRFAGKPLGDYRGADARRLRAQLQVVFQDPYGTLSPRMTVESIVSEGLRLHCPQLDAVARRAKVLSVLQEVGLEADALARYPHAFSGGQRQRIAIARALVLDPSLLILDEPTSALDVSVQKQVLELLLDLQRRRQLAYLFITHDLDVVRAVSHRLLVMRGGRVVEQGETEEIFRAPRSSYTRALLSSVGAAIDVVADNPAY